MPVMAADEDMSEVVEKGGEAQFQLHITTDGEVLRFRPSTGDIHKLSDSKLIWLTDQIKLCEEAYYRFSDDEEGSGYHQYVGNGEFVDASYAIATAGPCNWDAPEDSDDRSSEYTLVDISSRLTIRFDSVSGEIMSVTESGLKSTSYSIPVLCINHSFAMSDKNDDDDQIGKYLSYRGDGVFSRNRFAVVGRDGCAQ